MMGLKAKYHFITFVFLLGILSPQLGFSAIGQYSRELEILSLPLNNQKQIVKNDDQEMYTRLLEMAKNKNLTFSKRWKSIVLAGHIQKENSLGDFQKLIKNSEWFVKNAVLVTIQDFKHPEKLNIAKSLIHDSSLVVRSAAVDLLIKSGVDQNRDILWEVFFSKENIKKNKSLWIRNQVLRALSQMPKKYETKMFQKAKLENDQMLSDIANQGISKIVN